jgi:hypothetical protein
MSMKMNGASRSGKNSIGSSFADITPSTMKQTKNIIVVTGLWSEVRVRFISRSLYFFLSNSA